MRNANGADVRPDLPRAIAALFAAGAPVNPATQNISLIEITDKIGSRRFPAELPPVFFVVILVGGQPGTVYTTRIVMKRSKSKEVVADAAGPDLPFTSQIRRINLAWPLSAVSKATDAIKGAGVRCRAVDWGIPNCERDSRRTRSAAGTAAATAARITLR